MVFTYRDGVALLQLLVFVPAAPLALLLCIRHGFGKSSGWRFLFVFCLIRITGAICQMISISNPTKGVYIAILVCNSIAVSLLNLLCIGLTSRLNDQVIRRIPTKYFKIVEIIALVGLIIAITASSKQSGKSGSTADSFNTSPLSKVAVIIFAVVFCAAVLFFGMLLRCTNEIMQGERRLLVAIGIALPLVLVRLIYSIIFIFGGGLKWNNAFGDVTIYLCMAVLEEIAVVLVTAGVGITLRRLPKPEVADDPDTMELNGSRTKQGQSFISPVSTHRGNHQAP